MRTIAAWLFAAFVALSASEASAQTICNDPSGFLKTDGPIVLGNYLVLGPDCQHVQDSGLAAPQTAPTENLVTITTGTPCVINWTAHGLSLNSQVLVATSGTLATPLVQNTIYYAVNVAANTFNLATTSGGSAIACGGSPTGNMVALGNFQYCATICRGVLLQTQATSSQFVTLPNPTGFGAIIPIIIPGGNWELQGNVVYAAQGSTAYSEIHDGISALSSTMDQASPDNGDSAIHVSFITGQSAISPTGIRQVSFAVGTAQTYFLMANVTITGGSPMLAYGKLQARSH